MFHWRTREKRHGVLLDHPLDDPRRCAQCDGACCRAFTSIVLSWTEFQTLQSHGASRLELSLSGQTRLIIDTGCEFLVDGRCAIYPLRPEICRRFYCSDLPDSN